MILAFHDCKNIFRNTIDIISSKLNFFTKQLFAIMNCNYVNKLTESIPKAITFFANSASLHLMIVKRLSSNALNHFVVSSKYYVLTVYYIPLYFYMYISIYFLQYII